VPAMTPCATQEFHLAVFNPMEHCYIPNRLVRAFQPDSILAMDSSWIFVLPFSFDSYLLLPDYIC